MAEDGRKPSVWDTYAHTPGRIAMGHNADVSADQYHRSKEDIEWIRWLGCKAYRFSIAWPRILPDGTGQVNQKGLDYYERLVDELRGHGIEPYATLFHWDLPQALEDQYGGWRSREVAQRFADYATVVAARLGDRVSDFLTTNEFACFTDEGYGSGTKAPGLQLGDKVRNQVRHHALVGHGLAVQALRAAAPRARVGLAEAPALCVPVIEAEPHIGAARAAMRELNAPFLTAVLEGRYLDSYLKDAGADVPSVAPGDMRVISAPLDFIGLNCYTPVHVRADATRPEGYAVVPPPATYPTMALRWMKIGPEILYWAPRHLKEIWNVANVFITENGCPGEDLVAADGQIYDTERVMYLRQHLSHALRAIEEGWPLRGYFCWSLLDNFEWAEGFTQRLGLLHVDYRTLKRTPKLSAQFYKQVIAGKALV